MRVFLAVLICGVTPAWAAAQTAAATLPDNDTIVSIGWAGAEHKIYDQRRWHGSLLVGAEWRPLLDRPSENRGRGELEQPSRRARSIENIERRAATHTRSLITARTTCASASSQLYQFGRNEWVHPYVGIGADVVRRAASLDRLPQSRTVFVPPNRNIPVDISGGQRAEDDRVRTGGAEDRSEDVRRARKRSSTPSSSSVCGATSITWCGKSEWASISNGGEQ